MNMYTGLCYRWLLNADDHAYEMDKLMNLVCEDETSEVWQADALSAYIKDYVADFLNNNPDHAHASTLAFPEKINFFEIAEKWIQR